MFLRFFKTIFVFCNIIAAVLLVLSAFFQHYAATKIWFAPYLTLGFVPLALTNISFLVFWLIRFKWWVLLSLAALLSVYPQLKISMSPISFTKEVQKKDSKSIKMLTYNVMLFDYYSKKTKVFDYIKASDADVVCLQEFGWHYNQDGKERFLSETLAVDALNDYYPYSHITIAFASKNGTYGLATFSKYPIVNTNWIAYKSRYNSSIYTDIKVNDDTVRVFNNHLESNKLTKKDRENLNGKLDPGIVAQAARKLSEAASVRSLQADLVAKEIEQSPHPVIVCGDFNDTPVSYTYRRITEKLTDPFVGSGSGFGITFSDFLYQFRIDYILPSKGLAYANYNIGTVKYSDHYPVTCEVALP